MQVIFFILAIILHLIYYFLCKLLRLNILSIKSWKFNEELLTLRWIMILINNSNGLNLLTINNGLLNLTKLLKGHICSRQLIFILLVKVQCQQAIILSFFICLHGLLLYLVWFRFITLVVFIAFFIPINNICIIQI